MHLPEGSWWSMGATATLLGLLGAACAADLRTRRIPNRLVLVTALVGLAAQRMFGAGAGLQAGVGGLLVGLALWLPFWLLGMLGGGDVKLFAAGAAWLDPRGAVEAALFAGVAGGLLAMLWLVRTRGLTFTMLRLRIGVQQPTLLRESTVTAHDHRLPYALAMSAGLLLAWWRPGLLLDAAS